MTKPKRFAEGTDVPVSRSKAALDELLRRHNASQVILGADHERAAIFVAFTLGGRQVRLKAAVSREGRRNPEQLEREVWRALLLITKAKLEYIAMGQSSIESEFLANIVLPDGRTVVEDVAPKLALAYETGHLPPLLPAG
jgi:hypothetical protein